MMLPMPVKLQQTPSYQSFTTDSPWNWNDGRLGTHRDWRLLGGSANGTGWIWAIDHVDSDGSLDDGAA